MADDEHGHHGDGHADADGSPQDHRRGFAPSGAPALPGGLSVAANGFRLVPAATRIDHGDVREWTFEVRDEAGEAVTSFEETHGRLAHLVLVRRDLTRFQHLHPTMREDGTWSVEFGVPDPGAYRAFVDVVVDGQPTTLGVDLLASGPAHYEGVPDTRREVRVDGYEVALTTTSIPVGEAVPLEFEVRKDGNAVTLEEYLDALGHLVVLRDGDLAYLHVHPEETDPTEGVVRFSAEFPTEGRYRLFLQARPEGELITTTFDVLVGA